MSEGLVKAGPAAVKKTGARVGSHNAVFQGAFELPPRTDGPSYGPAILLKWRSDDGEEPGAIVSAQPTLKNSCGKLLSGMLGRPLRPDEVVEWSQFEGHRFVCIVTTNKSGTGTVVSEVARI